MVASFQRLHAESLGHAILHSRWFSADMLNRFELDMSRRTLFGDDVVVAVASAPPGWTWRLSVWRRDFSTLARLEHMSSDNL